MIFTRIKQRRLLAGLKQEAAANLLGITRSYLSQMDCQHLVGQFL